MSIKHLFRHITLWLIKVALLLGGVAYGLLSLQYNLQNMREIDALYNATQETSPELSIESAIAQLKLQDRLNVIENKILQLISPHRYDALQNNYLDTTALSQAQDALQKATHALFVAALSHASTLTPLSQAELETRQKAFQAALTTLKNEHIVLIDAKSNLLMLYIMALASLLLLLILWYGRKLHLVYGDIEMLLSVDKERIKELRTLEGTAIQRRVSKGGVALNSKSLLDPQTQLPNEKGLLNEFAHREGNVQEVLGVAYYDIDNLKELEMRHGKPFTDEVIKKFAFLLSLEKKPSDSIARIGDDEFVFIIARKEQDSAYAQATALIKSFEKTPFRTPKGEKIFVTASGGFALKDPFEKLDNALKSAQTLLKRAKLQGKNNVTKLHNFDRDREQRI
ncbi:MAG: hypothetical protein KU37_09955 [Sulfuricurvum sp. PC08-66]|nr:MAG: hypothetical protein KU37_09955 [Sulfuricurvum sp. PC08-66]